MQGGTQTAFTVLVVDASVETRERLSAMLSEVPGVGAIACSARPSEVLRLVSEHRPRCIVIDVPVRDDNGFKLLDELRRADGSPEMIVLMNDATDEFKRRVAGAGVNHFFTKSTEFECVIDLVRALGENAG